MMTPAFQMRRVRSQCSFLWHPIRTLFFLFFISFTLPHHVLASEHPSVIVHHDLIVTLHPESHSLTAEDTISFHHPVGLPEVLELVLNKNLVVDDTKLNGSTITTTGTTRDMSPPSDAQRLQVPLHTSRNVHSSPKITIRYHGKIADQPKGTPGLRFTTPDKTSGYIGTEGIYLTSETLWFPTFMDALATFHVRVSVPSGWESITQGSEVSHITSQGLTTSEWEVPDPSEALTLAANQFVIEKNQWHGITIATYLFQEDAHLSQQYLDATIMYLEIYTKLLGPYPFSKFAVVENFFPSGIGLPSYTLLGNRIIKRGYTQPYSLGHEIVHSWFGNSVFNDFSKGNWVEGLTTYLSNYYYEELHASKDSALKKRQQMFYEYNLYTTQQNEYPVKNFHHKETRLDNAIGYQKTALLFHMLRQEIGEDNFFGGIRRLIKEWTGKHADWSTLAEIFSKTTKNNLHWFFNQWLDRSGAPTVRLANTKVLENAQSPDEFLVNVTLIQEAPYYRFHIPVEVHFSDGTTLNTIVAMNDREHIAQIPTPTRPTGISIDPNFMVLRRLQRGEIPPMLNLWTTDTNPAVWQDTSLSTKERDAYQSIIHRLESQGTAILTATAPLEDGLEHSILILGQPMNGSFDKQVRTGCGNSVKMGRDWISIQGKRYDEPDMAWLVSCPQSNNSNHVVSFFYGSSSSAISRVARLLFFYGWDSYLVFQNGKVLTRGLFEPAMKTLDVLFDAA